MLADLTSESSSWRCGCLHRSRYIPSTPTKRRGSRFFREMKYLLWRPSNALAHSSNALFHDFRSLPSNPQMDRFAAKSEGAQATRRGFTLVVHGGAGLLIEENSSPQTWAKYHEGLEDALRAGYRVLAAASSSSSPTSSSSSSPSPSSSSSSQAQPQKLSLAMRAAMAAVASLEDNPLFNAGRGAVLTSEGTHEMDACVMDGRDLSSGAVTNLKCIKNPIFAAEAVRQLTTHAFMGGEGVNEWATQVAKSHPHMQLEVVDNTYFTTERRVLQLKEEQQHSRGESEQKHQQKEGVPQGHAALQDPERHVDAQPLGTAAGSATAAADTKPLGTVGAVCIDSDGNMAAATSTGGRTGKLPGRIGDTPVVGAGTYCDNLTCAISCTGFE